MPVTTSVIDDTLLIAIDRPPVNALDFDTIIELERVFTSSAQKAPRNGVVLTGEGQVFSAGVDVRAFVSYNRDQRNAMVRAITRMVAQLLAIPRPVVAAVNGHALGGGFVLMLGCDYRIATDSELAKLGMTEAQAGIPFPAGPVEIIRNELAPELLRHLALSSAVLTPRDFLQSRVLDELCRAGDLRSRALAMATKLAAQPGFQAVKRQVRGELLERINRFVASGRDPFLDAFG